MRIPACLAAAAAIVTGLSLGAAMAADCLTGTGEPRAITKACTVLLESGGLGASERAHALAQRGQAYYEANRFDRAMADLDAAIAAGHGDAAAHLARAKTYVFTGRYGDAIADFDEVIRQRPDDAAAYHARGAAFYGGGAFDKAIADFDRAIALDPDFAEAYFFRGVARGDSARGDEAMIEKAFADIRKAYELEPTSPIYRNRMADLGLLDNQ